MMGLPDGPKSFRIGLVVLIQYRLWLTAPSHPASHVAVAITLNAKASSLKSAKRTLSLNLRVCLCTLFILSCLFHTRPNAALRSDYFRMKKVLDLRRPISIQTQNDIVVYCLSVTCFPFHFPPFCLFLLCHPWRNVNYWLPNGLEIVVKQLSYYYYYYYYYYRTSVIYVA